jgi:hypothetical protein
MPLRHSGLQKEVLSLYRRCVIFSLRPSLCLVIKQRATDGSDKATLDEGQISSLRSLQFQDPGSSSVSKEREHRRAPHTTRKKTIGNVRKLSREGLLGLTGDARLGGARTERESSLSGSHIHYPYPDLA